MDLSEELHRRRSRAERVGWAACSPVMVTVVEQGDGVPP